MGPSEASQEGLADRLTHLSFSVHKSRRYHEKLVTFYTGWRNAGRVLTALSGSGALFLAFAQVPVAASVFSAIAGLWATLEFIFDPGAKAALHTDLCRRFTSLAERMAEMPATEERFNWAVARRLKIEKLEPPCKRLVDLQARNDELRARGWSAEELAPLSARQKRWGYFFTFDMDRLEKWRADRDSREQDQAHPASKTEPVDT